MMEVIKENQNQGQKVICYASHSNSRKLYNKLRNLTDNQILALKEVGGFIGVFSNKNFVSNDNFKKKYLEHIIHISNPKKTAPIKYLPSKIPHIEASNDTKKPLILL